MGIMEKQALDMSAILLETYDLSDMINQSAEVADYLYWKQEVENDESIREAVRRFERTKELYDEAQRFGHFHPDYHKALENAHKAEIELEAFEQVRRFKEAEEKLDELLHDVSKTIAHAVSESIKVPSNKILPDAGGCGSGGSCSGKCS